MKIIRRWRSRGGQVAEAGDLIIPHAGAGIPNPLVATLVVGISGGNWNGYNDEFGWGEWLGDGAGIVTQFASHAGNNSTLFSYDTGAAHLPEVWGVDGLGQWVEFSIADFNGGAWNRLTGSDGSYSGSIAGFGLYVLGKGEGEHVPVLIAWDE